MEDKNNMLSNNIGNNKFWSENNYVSDGNENVDLVVYTEDLINASKILYYDGYMSEQEGKDYIAEMTDNEIVVVCKTISDLSLDFRDDMFGWAKHLNGNTVDQIGDFMEDPKVGRRVLELCGGGYTKLSVLYHKAIQQPTFLFANRPMASLHPMLGREILRHLESIAPDTKFVITDANGFENLKSKWCEL